MHPNEHQNGHQLYEMGTGNVQSGHGLVQWQGGVPEGAVH